MKKIQFDQPQTLSESELSEVAGGRRWWRGSVRPAEKAWKRGERLREQREKNKRESSGPKHRRDR